MFFKSRLLLLDCAVDGGLVLGLGPWSKNFKSILFLEEPEFEFAGWKLNAWAFTPPVGDLLKKFAGKVFDYFLSRAVGLQFLWPNFSLAFGVPWKMPLVKF